MANPITKKKKSAARVAAATKALTKTATKREALETKPTAERTAAATEAPATLATKKEKTRSTATTASWKITFAQFQRYEALLKEQEEERGSHAIVGFHIHKESVDELCLHQSEMKPSYANIIKRDTQRASHLRKGTYGTYPF